MGIQGLTKVIGDFAPSAVKENDIKNYFGEENAWQSDFFCASLSGARVPATT